ncbi:mannan endo-1,6-alpha-mannosidase [Schizosaccharomyces japonicus yFS275]|uniref:mannan endo-1,6-alpha-mannosidase n=1 Tax=Schizosaccharomyces japonicus (strain yFS275 / FY16936) TaxID=402676 RepID=B6K7X6_SCHJY|nr:mannan endo-1,6-alpha-mannosidase [Schizosaccharomyces japonicus yFS275]EEB09630.2 mannan endo-1,6-alpha-mannosidase [Schizosaccharomyces japonicus yFS275]
MKFRQWLNWLLCTSFAWQTVVAFELNISSLDSIYSGIETVQKGLIDYWNASTDSFTRSYWWQTGSSLTTMLNTMLVTNNETYKSLIHDALVYNAGEDYNYQPSSEYFNLGNDDQGFWALAAMSAAENDFTSPDSSRSWLELTQTVFNLQVARWDINSCEGGLRWQAFPWLSGYTYKNSISNGLLFQLSARLARFSENETYAEWAEKIWDWSEYVGFVNTTDYSVYDGSYITNNCSVLNLRQWTYNLGVYLAGSAYMYNYTNGSDTWKGRLDGLITKSNYFFVENIAQDPQCEYFNNCNLDQTSFKGILIRFFGYAMQLAPYTHDTLMPLVQGSAVAAALACSGGYDGVTCGTHWSWNNGTWDSTYGVGQQGAALDAINTLLIDYAPTPKKLSSVSDQRSDPSAGVHTHGTTVNVTITPATESDRGGAGFLTALTIAIFLLGSIWAVFDFGGSGKLPARNEPYVTFISILRPSSDEDEKYKSVDSSDTGNSSREKADATGVEEAKQSDTAIISPSSPVAKRSDASLSTLQNPTHPIESNSNTSFSNLSDDSQKLSDAPNHGNADRVL